MIRSIILGAFAGLLVACGGDSSSSGSISSSEEDIQRRIDSIERRIVIDQLGILFSNSDQSSAQQEFYQRNDNSNPQSMDSLFSLLSYVDLNYEVENQSSLSQSELNSIDSTVTDNAALEIISFSEFVLGNFSQYEISRVDSYEYGYLQLDSTSEQKAVAFRVEDNLDEVVNGLVITQAVYIIESLNNMYINNFYMLLTYNRGGGPSNTILIDPFKYTTSSGDFYFQEDFNSYTFNCSSDDSVSLNVCSVLGNMVVAQGYLDSLYEPYVNVKGNVPKARSAQFAYTFYSSIENPSDVNKQYATINDNLTPVLNRYYTVSSSYLKNDTINVLDPNTSSTDQVQVFIERLEYQVNTNTQSVENVKLYGYYILRNKTYQIRLSHN